MDNIYNLKDLVVPNIGCYAGRTGLVVGIRERDLDDLQVISVRFPEVYRPVEYLPWDLTQPKSKWLLQMEAAPYLAITDIGGYEWIPFGDDPYDPDDDVEDGDEDDECEGHPTGPFDPMGVTVYCDGSCRGR